MCFVRIRLPDLRHPHFAKTTEETEKVENLLKRYKTSSRGECHNMKGAGLVLNTSMAVVSTPGAQQISLTHIRIATGAR